MESEIDKLYKARQAACQCIPRGRRAEIEVHMEISEDFTDGAWLAYMEGARVDISELEVFALDHNCAGIF